MAEFKPESIELDEEQVKKLLQSSDELININVQISRKSLEDFLDECEEDRKNEALLNKASAKAIELLQIRSFFPDRNFPGTKTVIRHGIRSKDGNFHILLKHENPTKTAIVLVKNDEVHSFHIKLVNLDICKHNELCSVPGDTSRQSDHQMFELRSKLSTLLYYHGKINSFDICDGLAYLFWSRHMTEFNPILPHFYVWNGSYFYKFTDVPLAVEFLGFSFPDNWRDSLREAKEARLKICQKYYEEESAIILNALNDSEIKAYNPHGRRILLTRNGKKFRIPKEGIKIN